MKATGVRSSTPTRNTASNVEEGQYQTHKWRSERKQAKLADGQSDTHQTEDETRGKGDDVISGTVPDLQEIITKMKVGSVTDSATKGKSDHGDINTDAANPDTQEKMTESNVRNDWDGASLILNHEDMNTEVKDLEEAREFLLQKQEHVLDKPISNGPF
nr:hypothetical protein CFP56_37581 [Quercus suber]